MGCFLAWEAGRGDRPGEKGAIGGASGWQGVGDMRTCAIDTIDAQYIPIYIMGRGGFCAHQCHMFTAFAPV